MTLRIIKRNNSRRPVYGLDVETDQDGNFFLGYVVSPDNAKLFWDKKELSRFLLKEVREPAFLVGHNIAYDLNSLLPDFNIDRLERGGRFITCNYDREYVNDYWIHKPGARRNIRRDHFKIVDLGNFIQQKGLKDISKDFKIPYLDVHDFRNSRIVEACYTHAKAVRDVFDRLQDDVVNAGGTMQLTAPATALNVFKASFLRPECQIWDMTHKKHEILEMKTFSRLAYHGGETDIFKRGVYDVTMIDVNSMYPYNMKKPMPNMNFWQMYDGNKDNWIDRFNSGRAFLFHEGCALIEMTIPYSKIPPFLIQVHNGITLSKSGHFFGCLTYPEIKYALEKGGRVTVVYQVLECKRIIGLFEDYINYWYEKKLNTATKQSAKLMQNSLYGKTGQVNRPEASYSVTDRGQVIDIETCFEYEGLIYNYEQSQEGNIYPAFSYPLIAAYVTAYARIMLHKSMCALGLDNIVYCDTDSIAIENLSLDEIKERVRIDDKELGAFGVKWEGKIETRGLKYYRYKPDNKCFWFYVIKGVTAREAANFWETENIFVVRPIRYRTALRYGTKVNKWVSLNYVRGKVRDKRIFDNIGNSEPYTDTLNKIMSEASDELTKQQKTIKRPEKEVQEKDLFDYEAYHDSDITDHENKQLDRDRWKDYK